MSTEIGRAVITGIAMAVAFAIWICSCIVTKVHKDRARHWIKHLRSALLLTWIAGMLRTIAQSIFVATPAEWNNSTYRFGRILNILSMPLLTIAQSLIFAMFTEFIVGLHYIKNGTYTAKARKAKIAAHILVGITVLLAVVAGCLLLAHSESAGGVNINKSALEQGILGLEKTFSVMFLIFAVAAVAVAITVKVMWKHAAEIRQAVKFFLASAIVYIIPHTYLIVAITAIAPNSGRWRNSAAVDLWLDILGPILTWFGTLAVLIIMFVLAAKKNPGMWTAKLSMKQSQDAHYQPAGQDWYGQNQELGYEHPQQYGRPQQYGHAELHGQHQPYSQAELYGNHNATYEMPGSRQQHELMGNEHGRGGQWGPPAELDQPVYDAK